MNIIIYQYDVRRASTEYFLKRMHIEARPFSKLMKRYDMRVITIEHAVVPKLRSSGAALIFLIEGVV
jgi:hypothetical protein